MIQMELFMNKLRNKRKKGKAEEEKKEKTGPQLREKKKK